MLRIVFAILALAMLSATTASAVLAPLPAPSPPTATPAYRCDWMGELHFRTNSDYGRTDPFSTIQVQSTEALDFVTAEVSGEACGMLWTGERVYYSAQQSPTICSYNWISTQQASGNGTGSFLSLQQFTTGRPIYLGAQFTAAKGGTITHVNEYLTPGCGPNANNTYAWTPSKSISDCFDTYYIQQGIAMNATSQATKGKCNRSENIVNATETNKFSSEISWRFKKINCDNSINSDGGSRSDCQEYDDLTDPMDVSDDPVIITDSTDPTITLNAPINGGSVTLGSVVNASYTCQDDAGGTGLASCVSSVANGATLDTSSLGTKTFVITATDNSGNSANATASYTVTPPPDTTKPTITLNSPLDGDNLLLGTVATASFSCQDESGGSGLSTCSSAVANGSPLNTSTLGTKTFTVTATDIAGNTDSTIASYTVILPPDTTKPTIDLYAPLNSGIVVLGSSATANYTCQDETGGSGIVECTSSVANGALLDTSTVGTKTFVVSAKDNAGNTETATATYTVQYQHSGFLGPVDSNVVNRAKAGQTVPVQFRLLDGNGNPISDSTSFVSLTSSGTMCNFNSPTDAIEQYSGGSGLQYLGNGYWQYNWKTAKTYAGQCRIIYLNLADGSKASARFQF